MDSLNHDNQADVIEARYLNDLLNTDNPYLRSVANQNFTIPKPNYRLSLFKEKGTSRQRSGKGAIRKRFPLQKPRWQKNKLTIIYLYH